MPHPFVVIRSDACSRRYLRPNTQRPGGQIRGRPCATQRPTPNAPKSTAPDRRALLREVIMAIRDAVTVDSSRAGHCAVKVSVFQHPTPKAPTKGACTRRRPTRKDRCDRGGDPAFRTKQQQQTHRAKPGQSFWPFWSGLVKFESRVGATLTSRPDMQQGDQTPEAPALETWLNLIVSGPLQAQAIGWPTLTDGGVINKSRSRGLTLSSS